MNYAFLGPQGTYSDFALKQLAPKAKAVAKPSLTDVFQAVATGEVGAGLVPIENKIQGPVTETLDLLFHYQDKIHIENSITCSINHCLGTISESIDLSKISAVYSHQQALDQCAHFLSKSIPHASRHPFESTSKAAQFVAENELETSAAVAAKSALLQAGLNVRAENIGNITDNQTRFVVIRPGQYKKQKAESLSKGEEFVTSIILQPGRDRQGLLFELLEIMSVKHQVNLLSIHSRPDLVGGFVFHIDLEGHLSDSRTQGCIESLNKYCQQQTADVAAVTICGSYKRATFRSAPFESIGIIGAHGAMGKFFTRFFSDAGFTVIACDKDTEVTAQSLTKLADVVLLSLPMSELPSVIKQILPVLKPGQLVVENCSVKQAALPYLLELAPAEVEVLGIHTMFGGDITSIRDQNVIITQTERSAMKSSAFEDILYKYGARLTKASVKEHDKRTSFVQSLVHFNSICLAEVMRESFTSRSELEVFSTPNARRTLETLERVVSQHPSLICDLQLLNPEAKEMRTKFLQTVFSLALALNSDETDAFVKVIEQTSAYFAAPSKPQDQK